LRQLHLTAGPNGSGKTTFVDVFLGPELPGYPYVNADEIAQVRWPDNPGEHAYEAAQVAAETRAHLIASGQSFIAETVFSHPSKLELIRSAQKESYQVVLHVMLVPEELAVERVAHRVHTGGHDVPEPKIRERYRRLWPLVANAIAMADRAVVYDNSKVSGPVKVAEFFQGLPIGTISWPDWGAPEPLVSRWGA
jgi:predicted ABC-type ATPase